MFDATLSGRRDSYEGNYAYLDEVPIILTALPGQRWRVYLRPIAPDSDLVADAASTIGNYLNSFGFEEVTHPTRFHCHTKIATRFRCGRILLAGNAAHVCSPAQGHGMNSGLQDAYNLAWKLAHVCQGHSTPTLLDSYEVERRPVAEMITASGDAIEQVRAVTDPVERRARDMELREVFADPTSRHHEAIAEAGLDIDYSDSPIVMGDPHEGLVPGQRLPDTIDICLANGEGGKLHELTYRVEHSALLIGGPSATSNGLAEIEHSLQAIRIESRTQSRCRRIYRASSHLLGGSNKPRLKLVRELPIHPSSMQFT